MFKKSDDDLKKGFKNLQNKEDVASFLEVGIDQLIYLLYAIPDHNKYTTFKINKRSGGTRTINAPIDGLKYLQKKLNYILSLIYLPNSSVHGFIEARSIVSNASPHVGKKFIFNVDIQDFFPSINFGRVRGLFLNEPFNFSENAATVIAQISCWDNQIPQGAPSSPIISNMICMKIDRELIALAKKYRCYYTRYVDDITFSTSQRNFPHEIAIHHESSWKPGNELIQIIQSNGFVINPDKVRMNEKMNRQEVTGLTVNRMTNVPRKFVRKIRAMLHAIDKYGIENAQDEFYAKYDKKNRNPKKGLPDIDLVIHGMLLYLKMVKGKNSTVYINYWNRFIELFPKYGEKILPDAKKIDIFLEGLTDKEIFDLAATSFIPSLLDRFKFISSRSAGANWVKDKLIERKSSRLQKLAIGIFDNDHGGNIAKKEVHTFLGSNGHPFVKTLKLPTPEHLYDIFKKGFHLPVGLEELYSPDVWNYANQHDLLDEREDIMKMNNFNDPTKTFLKFCEENGLTQIEMLYLTKCFSSYKSKRKIVKFISQSEDENKKEYLQAFQNILTEINEIS